MQVGYSLLTLMLLLLAAALPEFSLFPAPAEKRDESNSEKEFTFDRLESQSFGSWQKTYFHTLDGVQIEVFQRKVSRNVPDWLVIFAEAKDLEGANWHRRIEISENRSEQELLQAYSWKQNLLLFLNRRSHGSKILAAPAWYRAKEVTLKRERHRPLKFFKNSYLDHFLYRQVLIRLKKQNPDIRFSAMITEANFREMADDKIMMSFFDRIIILRNNSDGSVLVEKLKLNHFDRCKILLLGGRNNEVNELAVKNNIKIIGYRYIRPGFSLFNYNFQALPKLRAWIEE